MSDFFDYYGRDEDEELARIYHSGPDGLRRRDIAPAFFAALLRQDLIAPHGPEHYAVTRRGRIRLERVHRLSA